MKLRVLIACEFSGVVRRAFRDLGHDAISCDLLPAEDGNTGQHIQADAIYATKVGRPWDGRDWDLIIAHPPCTYLANSGVRWLSDGHSLNPERHAEMIVGCHFFAALYNAPCAHVAVENPVMHRYAREYLISLGVPGHSCSFQPWQHGEPEVKRSCLWLRGLPALVPSNLVSGRTARVHRASPGPNRRKERSRTLPGVARAMAAQWSAYLNT